MAQTAYIGQDRYSSDEPFVFVPLSIKPNRKQLIISQLPWVIACLLTFIGYLYARNIIFLNLLLSYTSLVLLIYLLFQYLYMSRMEYIITDDQIIFNHGVLSHNTDYMEMYRVIDYQQHRSLLQQISGLKTVTIYSGDRNTPKMDIIGINLCVDVVGEIRKRVEYNKQLKHVYEISNR